MVYCTNVEVKAILVITEVTWDAQITTIIVTSDAMIDSLLNKRGLTVPASVPELVKQSSALFAAWLFRRRQDPVAAEAFHKEAVELLNDYIGGVLGGGTRFRTGEGEDTDT